jgi:hypothetical protein
MLKMSPTGPTTLTGEELGTFERLQTPYEGGERDGSGFQHGAGFVDGSLYWQLPNTSFAVGMRGLVAGKYGSLRMATASCRPYINTRQPAHRGAKPNESATKGALSGEPRMKEATQVLRVDGAGRPGQGLRGKHFNRTAGLHLTFQPRNLLRFDPATLVLPH